AFSVWEFLENKTTSNDEYYSFIRRILGEEISHKFYASLIFYLFTSDAKRNKNRYKEDADSIGQIGTAFDLRCKSILYKDFSSGMVRNIFNADVSDTP